jgi:membrane-associated protein
MIAQVILLDFVWKDLLNPEFYIQHGGLWLFLFIVFAETGLFAGFFLPGDSLLFVAGIYSNELAKYIFDTGYGFSNLMVLVILTTIAGVVGNIVGYWFGRKVGPSMYHWKDRMIFKKKYLHQAHDFYEKHGGSAIVFARFLPIVRTFAPIVAGIVEMDRTKFSYYNLLGCIAWTVSMLFSGHYLYMIFLRKFDFDLKQHLEVIVLGIIFVTTAPVILKIIKGKDR